MSPKTLLNHQEESNDLKIPFAKMKSLMRTASIVQTGVFANCTSNRPSGQNRVIYEGAGRCVDAHTQVKCIFHTRRDIDADDDSDQLIDKIECQECQECQECRAEADVIHTAEGDTGDYRFTPPGCLTASLKNGTYGEECMEDAKANFYYACQDRKISSCRRNVSGAFEGNGTCQERKNR